MIIHQAPGHQPIACTADAAGCRICELIASDEHYRRLFGPPEAAPEPEPVEMATAAAEVQPAPGLPLAGDIIEALARRIGVDRVARWIEMKTGKPCDCPSRQAAINRLDLKIRKYLSRS